LQDVNNLHIGDEKNEISSHESFGFRPYQSSTWEEGIAITSRFHKVSCIDSTAFFISGGSCCLINQLSEIVSFNEINDVNDCQPINNKFFYTMRDDSPYTLFDHIYSLQVGYLKYKFRETCQENEKLRFQMIVMLGSYFPSTVFEIKHAKIFPQDNLHKKFTHEHH